jgi:oligoendopeptidase F
MRTFLSRSSMRLALAAAALLALSPHTVAQERERSQIAERYKWNLAEIYPSTGAWRSAKERIQAQLPKIGQFKGRLGSSAATLADALATLYELDKELSRTFVYVNMLADQDTRESEPQGMRQEMVQLAAAFSAEASYIEPEILRIPKATLEKFIASEPRLTVHRFYLEDILRRAAHTLSDSEEKILADAGPRAGSPSNV